MWRPTGKNERKQENRFYGTRPRSGDPPGRKTVLVAGYGAYGTRLYGSDLEAALGYRTATRPKLSKRFRNLVGNLAKSVKSTYSRVTHLHQIRFRKWNFARYREVT